jgi:SPP1 gp7 family putative phage head morphogenesis protein
MDKPANEKIFDATVKHQIKLLRFSENEALIASDLLAASNAEMIKKVEAGLGEFTESNIKATMASVAQIRTQLLSQFNTNVTANMEELATAEVDWEQAVIVGASPVALSLTAVPVGTIKALTKAPINGVPLENWTGQMTAKDIVRVEQQIRLGVVQGESIQDIVRRLRGTKAAKFTDGVFDTTRREAEMIARTTVNHISTQARQSVWDANADILQGLRWVATLDGRTSSVCQSRDGQIYPIDSGPRTPAHPNCRSTMAPVLAGEAIVGLRPTVTDSRTRRQREIDFRADAKAKAGDSWKGMKEADRQVLIRDERQTWIKNNIGQTPSNVSYNDWLKGQSKDFQDEVLGPGKADLFRNGMSLDKFVDEKGKPYTLTQLKAELEGDKFNLVQPGVGLKAKALLQQGLTSKEVVEQILKEFPNANTTVASVAYYKTELNKAGMLNLPDAGKVPTSGLKQALNLADVVNHLDANLPDGLKHAVGGQWATVVESLDGVEGAYSHYQAGKGVMLSAAKMAQLPAVQAQQVAAHELGHLLHKQHEVLLDQVSFDAMKAAVGQLTPDSKKLYSYYLGHIDELTAEVYAQALSPSPMTSQGLSALEFNKLFAEPIQAAKKAITDKFPIPAPSVKPAMPGGPVLPFEVAGKHSTVGSLAKALLQQGMPDAQVLQSVLAEFPTAKTKMASIQSYKSELKKAGALATKGVGPTVIPKAVPDVVAVAAPEVAIAAPEALKVSNVVLGPIKLKAEAIKLMESGVLESAKVKEQLASMYPNNAADLSLSKIAGWKGKWKKFGPSDYEKAALAKEGVAKVEAVAGPIAKPALYGKPLGNTSQKALNSVQSYLAGGGDSQGAYKVMEGIFGNIKEPGASEMLELAQYNLATAKAAGKPYLNAAYTPPPSMAKPDKQAIDMTPKRVASTPRDGLPPPPRFDANQRLRGLEAYGGKTNSGLTNRMNIEQTKARLPHLEHEEAASIRHYTGSAYRRMNDDLRSGQYSNNLELQALVEAAQSGLSKMPKFRGEVARGVSLSGDKLEQLLSSYTPGNIIEEHAFLSSSAGSQAAFGGNVKISIRSKTGVDVSSFSQYPGEREVLFMPGSTFRVDKIEKVEGIFVHYKITMTEV